MNDPKHLGDVPCETPSLDRRMRLLREGRARSYFVGFRHIGDLLLGRIRVFPGDHEGPGDPIFLTAGYDFHRNGLAVTFLHESYPPTPEGGVHEDGFLTVEVVSDESV